MKHKAYALVLSGCGMLVGISVAGAQTAPASTTAAGATPSSVLQEVTVTGSRIITSSAESPSPITDVSVGSMQAAQPGTLADNLNALPVFSGSRSQTGNPSPENLAGGNGAADELNLRNLGANRNLILLDGHRVPPTLTDGTVDVDMIPQMLIQKVEIVTGGTSAVYGSDAVSGVVNFIINKDFNGFKVEAQRGISQYDDDPTTVAGLAGGTDLFGDRGHIEASYQYRDDAGILYRSDRPWDNQWTVQGQGTAADPYQLVSNTRLSGYTFGGLITKGALAGQTFQSNGVLSPFVHGTASGSACCEIGGDGAYYDASLSAPLRMHQLFLRFDYDFSNDLHGYFMATGNVKSNTQYITSPVLANVTMSAQNGFLSPSYQSALAAAHQTTFPLSEVMSDDAPRLGTQANEKQYTFIGGLTGKVDRYTWDVALDKGITSQETTYLNNVNDARLAASLDAVKDPSTGSVVCNVTLTNPGLYPGCVPLDPFGPTAASASAINYVLGNTSYTDHTSLDDVEGDIKGAPFHTWAGPLNAALSFEWRRLTYDATSTALPTTLLSCAGLRFNCNSSNSVWANTFAAESQVSETVWEPALEVNVPLLSHLPLVRSLDLDGAVRYTSYSVSGTYVTWKAGLNWRINDSLTFRATKSRDIRAPTLADLYSPQSTQTIADTDYLTNVTPQVPLVLGGNPDLTAEIGHTSTAGFVLRPRWAPGLRVSLDGFYINITNAISSVLGYNPLVQRACYASGGSSAYCSLQTRPLGFSNTSPANAVTEWFNEEINISDIKTYGADFEGDYARDLLGRPLAIKAFVTFQPHLEFDTPGLSTLDHAGVAFSTGSLYPAPKWSVTGLLHYVLTDRLTADLMERWRSPYTMKDQPTQVWVNPNVPSVAYTNVNLGYDVPVSGATLELFVNVQNLFNTDPPPAAFYGSQTRVGEFGGWAIGDDAIGRYFTVGFRLRD